MSTVQPTTPVGGTPVVRRGPSVKVVITALLLAAALGSLVGFLLAQTGTGDQAGDSGESGQADAVLELEPADIFSFDPVGGSGLEQQDDTWRTQTYTTAEFGALKPGVGLVIDLGEAREVTSVELADVTEGLMIELRAGDEAPSDNADVLQSVDSGTTGAEGAQLSGEGGGAHRYWMVWITELAPRGDGFGAEMATPAVRGP